MKKYEEIVLNAKTLDEIIINMPKEYKKDKKLWNKKMKEKIMSFGFNEEEFNRMFNPFQHNDKFEYDK